MNNTEDWRGYSQVRFLSAIPLWLLKAVGVIALVVLALAKFSAVREVLHLDTSLLPVSIGIALLISAGAIYLSIKLAKRV